MSRPVPGRRFRLATVERLRAARLEAGGRELVVAGAALADARERRDLIAGRLLASSLASRATPEEALSLVARRDLLREHLAHAEREVAARVADAELARVAWLQARSGLRAVEALHERHRRAVRAEAARREQAETDEFAAVAATARDGGAP